MKPSQEAQSRSLPFRVLRSALRWGVGIAALAMLAPSLATADRIGVEPQAQNASFTSPASPALIKVTLDCSECSWRFTTEDFLSSPTDRLAAPLELLRTEFGAAIRQPTATVALRGI